MKNSKGVRSAWARFAACAAITVSVSAAASLPALAQTADLSAEATYSAILQRIADLELIIDQRQVFIETQNAKIEDLSAQIEQVAVTNAAIPPMIQKMVAAIENEIEADIPFNAGDRYGRLGVLKETLDDQSATPADKMRRALNIYDIEVGYGRAVEAYDGDHPVNPGARRTACLDDVNSKVCALSKEMAEKLEAGATMRDLASTTFDGVYLRHGRLALAYMSADGSETLQYNPETKAWESVSAGKVLEVRRGIRIARGQSAPGVMMAPVLVSN